MAAKTVGQRPPSDDLSASCTICATGEGSSARPRIRTKFCGESRLSRERDSEISNLADQFVTEL